MTFVQNQGSDVNPNVLHDQGEPNALRGVPNPPEPASNLRIEAYLVAGLMLLVAAALVIAGAV